MIHSFKSRRAKNIKPVAWNAKQHSQKSIWFFSIHESGTLEFILVGEQAIHTLSCMIIKACTSILCQKTILSFGSNIHACASSQKWTHDTYFLLPNDSVSMAWQAAKASTPSTDRNVGCSWKTELFRLAMGSRLHKFQIVVDIQYYSMVGERRVFRNHNLAVHQLGFWKYLDKIQSLPNIDHKFPHRSLARALLELTQVQSFYKAILCSEILEQQKKNGHMDQSLKEI